MPKDSRLDLGRYIRNPFNRKGQIKERLDFNKLFGPRSTTGQYPWNPSRFTDQDLANRIKSRSLTLNPNLNFVGDSPFFDGNEKVNEKYQLFEGLGRFDRPNDYDFETGRAMTSSRPQSQPDFDPGWVQAYKLSPTIKPGQMAKNPMPRFDDPDPNGYLMAKAEKQVEAEQENDLSVSELMRGALPTASEEEKGTEEIEKEEENPEIQMG